MLPMVVFQSAFIAVVCLTQSKRTATQCPRKVSIRFHRGGLTHCVPDQPMPGSVSIRFHRGGLPHTVVSVGQFYQLFCFTPLSSRWSASHNRSEQQRNVPVRFQSARIAVVCLTVCLTNPCLEVFQSAFIAVV